MPDSAGRAAGLVLGVVLDVLFADPRHWHPVAGFGRLAGRLERTAHRDSHLAGAGYATVLVAGVAAAGTLTERRASGCRAGRLLTTAAVTWAVVGGTSLRSQGRALGAELQRGDVPAARTRLPTLCGRDPSTLDVAGLARAGVESVAENTSDAVVGPLLWGACAGLPGLLAYRAVNTLDAMVGHRSPRYRRFGWAAARADDLANLVPARVCALLACACAPVVGGSPAHALRTVRRDGRRHPSPNAGMVEAAFAGALGVRLGGELRYPHGVEHRPVLGDGRPPGVDDLAATARLSAAVTVTATLLAAFTAGARSALSARAGRSTGGGA